MDTEHPLTPTAQTIRSRSGEEETDAREAYLLRQTGGRALLDLDDVARALCKVDGDGQPAGRALGYCLRSRRRRAATPAMAHLYDGRVRIGRRLYFRVRTVAELLAGTFPGAQNDEAAQPAYRRRHGYSHTRGPVMSGATTLANAVGDAS